MSFYTEPITLCKYCEKRKRFVRRVPDHHEREEWFIKMKADQRTERRVWMQAYRSDYFIAKENMDSIYELESISNLSETAYCHFLNCEDEILYLLKVSKLLGVLSIGDLEHFFQMKRVNCK